MLKLSLSNRGKHLICYGLIRSLADNSKLRLSAHVSYPYSYAFGRSDKELQFITIGEQLTKIAETEKSKTAVISYHENISKTYEQLNSDVNQLANGLYNQLGLRRGDVVGLWSCNSYAWLQLQYACAKLGLILCTINPAYLAQELNFTLRKAQIKALFMPGLDSKQEIVNKFQKVFEETLKKSDKEECVDPLKLKQVIVLDGYQPNLSALEIETYLFESLLTNQVCKLPEEQTPSSDDPAIIMFTSGTTGKPKGALLSHFTLINNALLSAYYYREARDYEMKLCVPLPLFHAFAAVYGGLLMTALPTAIVLTCFKYDVKSIVDAMKSHDCTHIIATPTIIIDILNYVQKHSITLDSLRGVFLGGASVPVEVCHRVNKIFPAVDDIRIGYGATETGPVATLTHKFDSFENRTQTIGSAFDFVEIKLVDPRTGLIKKIGETGELLCRGHNIMLGYWRDEQKTSESIDETKWYKTGDLAVMDEFGYFKIIGRTKEMIIRGGENIYPREIEELLHKHPQVIDAYVIGVPDERTGEEVCAWIKLKADSKVTAEEIKQFCKNNISYYKNPRYILFVDDFPLTPAGKAKKFVMRERSCEILGLKQL